MKLALLIDGRESHIEILDPLPNCRFRVEGDSDRQAYVETPEPGIYSILLDGRVYDARVEEGPGPSLVVVIDGFRFELEVRDPRRWMPKSTGASGEGTQTMSAPMPGKVVRILVAPGDIVAAGQGVIVVEAMKMQNEMKTPRAGRVLSLSVTEGATVAAGQALVTIE